MPFVKRTKEIDFDCGVWSRTWGRKRFYIQIRAQFLRPDYVHEKIGNFSEVWLVQFGPFVIMDEPSQSVVRMMQTSRAIATAAVLSLLSLHACTKSPAPPDIPTFTVERVVDGDTVRLETLGSVRLIGIDCPETVHPTKPVQCYGPEASARTKELLPPGERVRVQSGPEDADFFGRKLRYLFRASDRYDVNLGLVLDGFCEAETGFAHPRMEEFVAAEEEAREADVGLWGECGEAP